MNEFFLWRLHIEQAFLFAILGAFILALIVGGCALLYERLGQRCRLMKRASLTENRYEAPTPFQHGEFEVFLKWCPVTRRWAFYKNLQDANWLDRLRARL